LSPEHGDGLGYPGYRQCWLHRLSHRQDLLERGDAVVGLDVVNDYYDPQSRKRGSRSWKPPRAPDRPIASSAPTWPIAPRGGGLCRGRVRRVVNLAAQAGVRYSIENPTLTSKATSWFTNILEACRHGGIEHLVYASTSSVYGANKAMPFSEHVGVDHPCSSTPPPRRPTS
jgi:UDP-glucuronate 4-epimerase